MYALKQTASEELAEYLETHDTVRYHELRDWMTIRRGSDPKRIPECRVRASRAISAMAKLGVIRQRPDGAWSPKSDIVLMHAEGKAEAAHIALRKGRARIIVDEMLTESGDGVSALHVQGQGLPEERLWLNHSRLSAESITRAKLSLKRIGEDREAAGIVLAMLLAELMIRRPGLLMAWPRKEDGIKEPWDIRPVRSSTGGRRRARTPDRTAREHVLEAVVLEVSRHNGTAQAGSGLGTPQGR